MQWPVGALEEVATLGAAARWEACAAAAEPHALDEEVCDGRAVAKTSPGKYDLHQPRSPGGGERAEASGRALRSHGSRNGGEGGGEAGGEGEASRGGGGGGSGGSGGGEHESYDAVLRLLKQSEAAKVREQQRAEELILESEERTTALELELHEAKMESFELRKKLRRMQGEGSFSELFALYEDEIAALQAVRVGVWIGGGGGSPAPQT